MQRNHLFSSLIGCPPFDRKAFQACRADASMCRKLNQLDLIAGAVGLITVVYLQQYVHYLSTRYIIEKTPLV